MAGMNRRCPICNELLRGITTDWVLSDRSIAGHAIATIGTARNARDDIRHAAQSQITANLAAYKLDFDAELNLGFRGTAWLQCPQAREQVTRVTFPN